MVETSRLCLYNTERLGLVMYGIHPPQMVSIRMARIIIDSWLDSGGVSAFEMGVVDWPRKYFV